MRQYTGTTNQPALTNSRQPSEFLHSLLSRTALEWQRGSGEWAAAADKANVDVYRLLRGTPPDPAPQRRKARRRAAAR